MTTQTEFIQTHAQDGVLSPQHAAELLEQAMGDTSAKAPDKGDEPIVTAAADTATENAENESAKPILAKDGVHTIAYQKLVDARNGEQHWKAQATAHAAELEALKAEALTRADAGQAPTQADNVVAAAAAAIEQGVDPAIFGDYSEEALAKGIRTLIRGEVEQMRTEFNSVVNPLKQTQADNAQTAHTDAIYAAHPDADSIALSVELSDWIAAQPSFARAGYESVLQKGSTAEIVEFFATFKAATGKTQAADPKAAARALIANAAHPAPASLSDIPGGHAGPGSRTEALDRLVGIDLADALQNMPKAQQDAYLNRQM